MNVEFRSSFLRDIKKLPDLVAEQLQTLLLSIQNEHQDLYDIPFISKMSGYKRSYYRIRMGEYRIGCLWEDETLIFMRVLPRKDIYRRFP